MEARKLVKIAAILRKQLQLRAEQPCEQILQVLKNLVELLERITGFQRRLKICQAHNWKIASTKIIEKTGSTVAELSYFQHRVDNLVNYARKEIPSLRHIYQELFHCNDEFEELCFHKDLNTVSAKTEPIVMEGVYLGEFEIRLQLEMVHDLDYSAPFSVEALDPNPAAGDDSVTHPHVQNERLCAGNGDAAIRNALSSGCVCDFFMIIRSILNTYNPNSPHIELHNWDGRPCSECGDSINPEELYFCQFCESDMCAGCSALCQVCEETTCPSCIQPCQLCRETVCPGCQMECPGCGNVICSTCLNDEQCTCMHTEEEEENNEQEIEGEDNKTCNKENQSEQNKTKPTNSEEVSTQVLANSLGKTDVF